MLKPAVHVVATGIKGVNRLLSYIAYFYKVYTELLNINKG
jgi:hypothetical protein